jgi:hypothetical protein
VIAAGLEEVAHASRDGVDGGSSRGRSMESGEWRMGEGEPLAAEQSIIAKTGHLLPINVQRGSPASSYQDSR